MESAHSAYRRSKATSLTRVDLLISLYEKTLATLDAGIEAKQIKDDAAFQSAHFTAWRCVLALLDGIDPERSEVCENTQRLCLFAANMILESTVESWQNAKRVLKPLHDSFTRIREEAVVLELNGEIPALNFQTTFEHTVV
jgi:hypothetical protein